MNIVAYEPVPGSLESLLSLVRRSYPAGPTLEYFCRDFAAGFAFSMAGGDASLLPLGAYEGRELIGHIALIEDARLPAGEALFGFMELPDDSALSEGLWNALIALAHARGISTIKGPVNGSIWHQYRCVKSSDGSAPFLSEPLSQPHLYRFLASKAPSREIEYCSARRADFGFLLPILAGSAAARAALHGCSIERLASVSPRDMQAIAELSRETFRESWGYVDLTPREFLALYPSDKISAHLSMLYVARREGMLVGYASVGRDANTAIAKTICVASNLQGKGIGTALASRMHADISAEGMHSVIYALMRSGNAVSRFPTEKLDIFRTYAAFEYDLS